jgi:hypothetical protein
VSEARYPPNDRILSTRVQASGCPADFRSQTTHWSTDLRVPVIERSFFSSTVTTCSVRVLKTLAAVMMGEIPSGSSSHNGSQMGGRHT